MERQLNFKYLIPVILIIGLSCSVSYDFSSQDRSPSSDDPKYQELIIRDQVSYKGKGADEWVRSEVEKFIDHTNSLDSSLPPGLDEQREVSIVAKRNPFRDILYKEGFVEASDRTLFMFDKLYMARILEHYLGESFRNYHQKTDGLKEFLLKKGIVARDGKVIKSAQEIKALFELEFPQGFILKPPVGMSSAGKSFYKDPQEIVELIMKQDGEIYSPDEVLNPFHWKRVRRFTSGERYIIQEKLDGTSGIGGNGNYGDFNEFRVHSFYDKVVDGGTETRWYTKNSELKNKQVNDFVQGLLDRLPKELTYKQAWSFDVFWLPDGQMRLIEVNTNWGEPGNWSGFFRTPKTLGAYVRHFESRFKWSFKGFSGWLLRNNWGNLRNHIDHEKYEYWEDLKNWFKNNVADKIVRRKTEESLEYFKEGACEGAMCFSSRFFYTPYEAPRVGLEVELTGLTQKQIVTELQHSIGGTIESRDDVYEYIDPTTKEKKTVSSEVWKIKKSKIGKVLVVVEDNGLDMSNLEESTKESKVTEIITEPIGHDQVKLFQKGLDRLVAKGARGTNSETPVSIQVNVEIVDKKHPKLQADFLINLMRNYYRDENFSSIQREIPLIAGRENYVGVYSPGFMEKLFTSDYRPDMRELFDDYFYRQSAEYLGLAEAWSGDLSDVQQFVKNELPKQGFESILKVFKWNDLRVSSALIEQFPEDWISDYLEKTDWVKARPLVEFRRPNNNFNALEATRRVVGIVQRSRVGEFSYPEEVAKRHGIDVDGVKAIMAIDNPYEKPYVVRQFLGAPDNLSDKKEYDEFLSLKKFGYKRSIPLWVDMDQSVREPYILPGESVVFHRLPDTGLNIMGKYNPSLVNAELSKVLDHKYVEARFWEKYAKGVMPKTKLLGELSSDKISPRELRELLNREFPNGWVIKGVWDNATQADSLITNETDLEVEIQKYKDNQEDFIKYMQKVQKDYGASNPDLFVRKLRERPEFIGYRVNKFLKSPELSIVQEKLSIKEEYRVEVISGRVLGNGSTIPRYQYEYPDDDSWLSDPNIKRVESYAQDALDQLPAELRGMTFGMDIAVLRDGSIKMIESNPQGNSGFLAYDKRSVKALDKFLMSYPQMVKSGEVQLGMEPVNQLRWARTFIEGELKMDVEVHYPHLTFLNNKVVYTKRYGRSCRALLLPLLRLKAK